MLITTFVLVYLKPDILKKIMIYFKDIDESSTYQDLDTLMSSYVNIRNQRKYNDRKLNIPSNNSVRNRNFQRNYNNRVQNSMTQQINPNANTGSTNINLLKNPPGPQKNKKKCK